MICICLLKYCLLRKKSDQCLLLIGLLFLVCLSVFLMFSVAEYFAFNVHKSFWTLIPPLFSSSLFAGLYFMLNLNLDDELL
ncbi:hypothetical protein L596_021708 [Steinernema carpocapsae]|uniref:Uncharacterized protein n=1 Tax=Steinernema carpocapsae TaxID=34508 RepID=A0A4U5MJL5_STECR|nr:hypothetical protein L596_021708 [Steinernema carpocapsae]